MSASTARSGAGPSKQYSVRAARLGRAIDIAARVLAGGSLDHEQIELGDEIKQLMNTPPQRITGLRYLESDFFIYWNECAGPHVVRFWEMVAAEGLPFARRDVLSEVLTRGRINNAAEHEIVIDALVGAEP